MNLLFDARVLTHKSYTGVENYAKNILDNIKDKFDINILKPKTSNKYLAHLWTHFILPFQKADLLFCPANIAPVFVPKNKKLVVTIHDVAFQTYPNSFSKFFRLYYKFIIPINVKRADKIITVSNSSKNEIEKYYSNSKGKIEVIYLGLDKRYKVIEHITKEKSILFVGSLNERKNFSSIIEAFELVNKDAYKLVIVGNFSSNFSINDETSSLLKKAKENKNIEFKSNISDDELVKIYNKAELFIFPSFYEGFGLPPLEAMACATPVITSNLTSMPEVCGDAVIYCNPYSVEDIKEKIDLVLSDKNLQKQMIQKGLARVKEFTWEDSAKKHVAAFKEVLEN